MAAFAARVLHAQANHAPKGKGQPRDVRTYDSKETKRFGGYYEAMSGSSSEVLAKNSLATR